MKFQHLEEKQVSYISHFKNTLYLSYHLIRSGIAVFIHGLYPDIFVNTASNTINNLYLEINSINKKLD